STKYGITTYRITDGFANFNCSNNESVVNCSSIRRWDNFFVSMYAQAFWVARSFLLVSEAFTDFSGIFSNVASVIMDINTGALMFLNISI
ncbi:hypothetical protein D917_10756, partial [Trichinella nativa]